MISFTVWKDFWFDVAYLFIFAYVSIASGFISQILYTDPNLYIHIHKHMCVMYIYNLTIYIYKIKTKVGHECTAYVFF